MLEEVEACSKSKGKPLTPSLHFALKTYDDAARSNGFLDERNKFAGLHLDDWRPVFYSQSTADNTDTKRKAFDRARKTLCEHVMMSVKDDVYRLEGEHAGIKESLIAKAILERETTGQDET